QLFWSLAGLKSIAANSYLRLQRTELEWVRDALRNWTFICERQDPRNGAEAEMDYDDRLRIVQECWVARQANYFEEKVPRARRRLVALVAFGWAFMIVGFLWALIRSGAKFQGEDL